MSSFYPRLGEPSRVELKSGSGNQAPGWASGTRCPFPRGPERRSPAESLRRASKGPSGFHGEVGLGICGFQEAAQKRGKVFKGKTTGHRHDEKDFGDTRVSDLIGIWGVNMASLNITPCSRSLSKGDSCKQLNKSFWADVSHVSIDFPQLGLCSMLK